MEELLKKYTESKKAILNNFNCETDYFIKNIEDYNWRVKDVDGMFFLTYWREGEKLNECIIVKKNNSPVIVRQMGYTMAVVIECIKIALILRNDMEV